MSVDSVFNDSKVKMDKAMAVLKEELLKVRTGRASVAILDDIRVDYYGQQSPLNQIASLNTPDARLITITPWEKSMLQVIEKAILKSGIGLTPANDGHMIRLPVPPLTEERRRDLVKFVKKLAEDSKIAMRNIRRDANETLKKLEKDSHVPEDDVKKGQDKVQVLTDDHIKKVDEIVTAKEKEIMTV